MKIQLGINYGIYSMKYKEKKFYTGYDFIENTDSPLNESDSISTDLKAGLDVMNQTQKQGLSEYKISKPYRKIIKGNIINDKNK